jgi:hypothetical protein
MTIYFGAGGDGSSDADITIIRARRVQHKDAASGGDAA